MHSAPGTITIAPAIRQETATPSTRESTGASAPVTPRNISTGAGIINHVRNSRPQPSPQRTPRPRESPKRITKPHIRGGPTPAPPGIILYIISGCRRPHVPPRARGNQPPLQNLNHRRQPRPRGINRSTAIPTMARRPPTQPPRNQPYGRCPKTPPQPRTQREHPRSSEPRPDRTPRTSPIKS